jgi:hypothetical protein
MRQAIHPAARGCWLARTSCARVADAMSKAELRPPEAFFAASAPTVRAVMPP